jgi:hypothetical protein
MGKKNACKILMGKPKGKRLLGRPRRKWVDDSEMNLRNIVWRGVDWIDVAQDMDWWRAVMNTAMEPRM